MLLVCICSYRKSVVRYKFLIFDIYNPDTLYLREQGCADPWLFFEAKRGPRGKMFGEHRYKGITVTCAAHVAIQPFKA
jgi:hypothetical protein